MSAFTVEFTENILDITVPSDQLDVNFTENLLDVTVTDDGLDIVLTESLLDVTIGSDLEIEFTENLLNVSYGELVSITNNYGAGVSVIGEISNGTIDGSNATFTTDYDFDPDTVQVFYNGLAQYNPTHYTTSGVTTITLNFSPASGDVLTVNYDRA